MFVNFMKPYFFLFYLFPLFLFGQNVPKIGSDTLLDVGAWNAEWFGDTGYGPTDETLQFNNVKAVIEKTDFDVLALEEMSNAASFIALTNSLPNYSSVNSTFSQTQKMCLFYKKSMFNFINAEHILASSNYDFASRQPLMVTLATKGDSLNIDTMYFIVVHLKANSDATATAKLESYNRRKRAANALKVFIESTLQNKKYFILGDWNDRLDFSIHNGIDTTPFKQLLDAKYNFTTKPLADAGKRSYAFSDGFIDHLMISPRMDSFYLKQSVGVLDNLGQFITNFSNTTSDHYPIYSRFLMNKKKYVIPIDTVPNDTITKDTSHVAVFDIKEKNKINIYPNPANEYVTIEYKGFEKDFSIELLDFSGKLVETKTMNSTISEIDIRKFTKGFYTLKINQLYYKLLIE
ncbi:MAG: T9SS type A sorting domain-containing protein [Bacteroidia bacterium]